MVKTHAAQSARAHLPINPPSDALPQSIGLLVDFFVHVVRRIAKFCFPPRLVQHRDVRFDRVPFHRRDVERAPVYDRNIAVLEVNDPLGVRCQRMRIA